jgi:hypothetical protein
MTEEERLKKIRELAEREANGGPSRVELDGVIAISEGEDNGCYVQCWMWVSFAGTELDKEKE